MAGFRFGYDFRSGGVRCDGWLYTPVRDGNPPVVVMAHGFGAERSWGLPEIGREFAGEGVAAFLFDYRGFGDSDGTPRRVIDPGRQVADLRAAVEHVRSIDRVGDRIALWGYSFGAGNAASVAARERVAALVARAPFLDGRATVRSLVAAGGPSYGGWLAAASLRDLLRQGTFRSPHYVPVAGDPDELAVLNRPGTKEGYASLVPDDEEWDNRCAARIALKAPFYRPITRAGEIDCPALVVQAEHDGIVPAGPVDRFVDALDDVERVRYDAGHFEVVTGGVAERVLGREASFLARHLLDDEE